MTCIKINGISYVSCINTVLRNIYLCICVHTTLNCHEQAAMWVDRGWGGGQSALMSTTTKLQRGIQHYFCLINTRNVGF